jgi:hypothetical protein
VVALGERHPPRQPYTYWANGKVEVGDGWGSQGRPSSLQGSMAPLKRVYRVNGRLRKLGLEPKPPGASPWRDKLKSNAIELCRCTVT